MDIEIDKSIVEFESDNKSRKNDTENEMSMDEWRSLYGRHWHLVTRTEEEFDDLDQDRYEDL